MHKTGNRAYIYQIDLSSQGADDVRIIASSYIDNCSKVLDVGCACGDFGYYISNRKQCDVYGMEYNAESIKTAFDKQVYKEIHQMDLNTFETDTFKKYLGKFDYITLLDVLEHTINPEESLMKLVPYLKDNGFLIISLPNVSFGDIKISLLQDDFEYTDMGILDRTHLRFFTHKTIDRFFTLLNLEIVECKVKVEDISFPMHNLSIFTKRQIKANPFSYVYQYVLKIRKNSADKVLLFRNNRSKMVVTKKIIRPELKRVRARYRKNDWISKFLPVGSGRRNIVKKVVSIIKRKV